MPGTFAVVDLSPACELRQQAQYTYELLERIPGAAELIGFCSGQIWRSPDGFETPLPPALANLVLRWRSVGNGAGILTTRGQLADASTGTLGVSLFLSGIDPHADQATLEAFQQHVVRELHDTGFEPAFDLLELRQRPLVASMGLSAPKQPSDQWTMALLDRCFGASYFRHLKLA